MKKVDKIINFMRALEEVCIVKRDMFLYEGTTENNAIHIFKLSFLVMMITPYLKQKVDYTKMLEMALVHDIAEGKTGDYTLANQIANPTLKLEKKKREEQAIKELKSILPTPLDKKVYSLYKEYEEKKTIESKIVSMLDKLEANLQANQYHNGDITYWQECENGDLYYKIASEKKPMIKEIDEKIITELEDAILTISQQNIKKCNIHKG